MDMDVNRGMKTQKKGVCPLKTRSKNVGRRGEVGEGSNGGLGRAGGRTKVVIDEMLFHSLDCAWGWVPLVTDTRHTPSQ